jgi:hypothetical protein
MTTETDLGARLKAMALTILRDAEEQSLGMRLDALKVCTMLHLGLEKMNAGTPEAAPPADEGMLGMRKRIEEAGNGGGK